MNQTCAYFLVNDGHINLSYNEANLPATKFEDKIKKEAQGNMFSGVGLLASSHARIKMMQTNSQATNCPYPTTNTPSLTIHHALIVCEALCRVCPCDKDRDAKEDDCAGISTSDQFS